MPRASTPRLAPGFTLPTRRTFILPGSEPITATRHLLDQTNETVLMDAEIVTPTQVDSSRAFGLRLTFFRVWALRFPFFRIKTLLAFLVFLLRQNAVRRQPLLTPSTDRSHNVNLK
ncbi:hypothetical protein DFH27DRAFT_651615 [Peziza echinospora]|nr:hypothetical protein DFH27DRAFT_651615 [Peziza echinospora]